MKSTNFQVAMLGVFLFFAPAVLAQSPASANQSAASPAPSASAAEVPRLIKFSGTLLDALDRPLAGPVGVTFALHAQQTSGAALWMETQNVTPDAHGFYTVLLGANSAYGVPAELFASGEARWLDVQVEQQAEQPRVLLVSVPYALKAGDAQTLGGKPASAFLTTETLATTSSSGAATSSNASATLLSSHTATTPKGAAATATINGTGTANFIAKFKDAADIQNSAIFESGGNVSIGTTSGNSPLTVTAGGAPLPVVLGLPTVAKFASPAGTVPWGLRQNAASLNTPTFMWFESADGPLGFIGAGGTNIFRISGFTGDSLALGSNAKTQVLIDTSGKVGIGTTTPLGRLEIQGGADNTGLNDPQAVALAFRTGGWRHWIRTRHNSVLGSGNAIDFFVNNSTAPGASTGPGIGSLQVMTLDSGNVGIGTTTPTDALDVFGPPTEVNGQAIFSQGGPSTAASGSAADGIDPIGGSASGLGGFGGFGVFAVAGNGGPSGVGGFGVEAFGGNASGAGGIAGDGGDFIAGAGSNGATNGLAGFFSGNISVTGTITAGVKDFKIDHPLDPANKYLVHATVESSEMLNIYTGNASLDASGGASVLLPGWFEVLNKDFRYQLTAIGAPGPNLYIAQEIQGGHFVIAGGHPGMKVSWQVTGVRQDAFAKAHPLVVEEEKLPIERGRYIHPELYGAPAENGIAWARHPQLMKKMNERRAKQAQAEPVRPAAVPH